MTTGIGVDVKKLSMNILISLEENHFSFLRLYWQNCNQNMKSEYKGTKFLNLACGENFIINEKWLNFDFIKREGVNQINLLEKLPLDDQCVDVVYCSHFIEHIPEHMVSSFLTECFRVLKNNGALRVVLPDFEKMVREYIKMRDLKMENKAEFMMVSIIDQFVRKTWRKIKSYY